MSFNTKKFLFYLLSFTWGLPMTLVGCLVALVMCAIGKKPIKHGTCWYFKIGKNWGGLELGVFFLTDNTPAKSTLNHEHGHALQNCVLGPLMPFLVAIPSATRYWYRELRYWRRGKTPPTAYDDIWFEGQATRIGTKFVSNIM